MAGRLNLGLSRAWRDRYIKPEEREAIEARIPDGHYLYVVNETRKAGAWRLSLHREGADRDALWTEHIGRTLVGACHRALSLHEDGPLRVTTTVGGYVTDIEEVA